MPDPYNTTVIVQSASIDLTVLDTVKQELGITNGDSDDLLLRYISEQSDVVTRYCGRKFAQETVVDSFRLGYGSYSSLNLSRRPIASITSIDERGTMLGSTDYEVDYNGAFLWRVDSSGNGLCWSAGKIVVTYIGGYELLTTLPRDIERATIILIKQAWFERTRDPRAKSERVEGIGSLDLWVGSIPGSEYISSEAAELLCPYRNLFV